MKWPDYLVRHRRDPDFMPDLIDVDQALDQAESSPQPVCLLDIGDNVGGGSPADGTVIARTITSPETQQRAPITSFAYSIRRRCTRQSPRESVSKSKCPSAGTPMICMARR